MCYFLSNFYHLGTKIWSCIFFLDRCDQGGDPVQYLPRALRPFSSAYIRKTYYKRQKRHKKRRKPPFSSAEHSPPCWWFARTSSCLSMRFSCRWAYKKQPFLRRKRRVQVLQRTYLLKSYTKRGTPNLSHEHFHKDPTFFGMDFAVPILLPEVVKIGLKPLGAIPYFLKKVTL